MGETEKQRPSGLHRLRLWLTVGWLLVAALVLIVVSAPTGDDLQVAGAVLLGGCAVIYAATTRWMTRRWKAALAVLALAGAVVLVFVRIWSPSVASGLGHFVTSAGLGGVAVAGAAALALYGLHQQLDVQRDSDGAENDRELARERMEHFRWVTQKLVEAQDGASLVIVGMLLEDLAQRATSTSEEDLAALLLRAQLARLKSSAEEVDDSPRATSARRRPHGVRRRRD